MLHDLVRTNRAELISRARRKGLSRAWPPPSPGVENGIPLFMDQLSETLRLEATRTPFSPGRMDATAEKHGRDLLEKGFTVSQVVHDYGDVCQAITEMAVEGSSDISAAEFHTLNQLPGRRHRRRGHGVRSPEGGGHRAPRGRAHGALPMSSGTGSRRRCSPSEPSRRGRSASPRHRRHPREEPRRAQRDHRQRARRGPPDQRPGPARTGLAAPVHRRRRHRRPPARRLPGHPLHGGCRRSGPGHRGGRPPPDVGADEPAPERLQVLPPERRRHHPRARGERPDPHRCRGRMRRAAGERRRPLPSLRGALGEGCLGARSRPLHQPEGRRGEPGKIHHRNLAGQGCIFTIDLPQAPVIDEVRQRSPA